MKKTAFIIAILVTVLMLSDGLYGGFGFGITGAAKNRVKELDKKVRENSDSTPPDVSSTSPSAEATYVEVSEEIEIIFTEDLDESSVNAETFLLYKGQQKISGSVTLSNNSVFFNPDSYLNYSATYTFTVKGSVKDLAGNIMGRDYSFNFYTRAMPASGIYVTSRTPSENATGVICGSTISVTYNTTLDPSSVSTQTVRVYEVGGSSVAGIVSSGSSTIFFKPDSALNALSTYTVTLSSIQSSAGVQIDDQEWSFNTGRLLYVFNKGQGGFYFNPLTMDDSKNIYVGTSRKSNTSAPNNYIFKLNSSLEIVWEYNLGYANEVVGSAALDSSGNAYFPVVEDKPIGATGANQAYLYKFNSSGSLVWKSTFSANADFSHHFLVVDISSDDSKIFVGGQRLHCFSSAGDLLWIYPEYVTSYMCAPAIDSSGFMYLANLKLDLAKSPADAGFEVWNSSSGAQAGPSSLSTDESLVFVSGNGQKEIICMDTLTGTKQWSFDISPWEVSGDEIYSWSGAVVDENDYLYFGTKTNFNVNSVYFCITSTGGLVWANEEFNDDTYCTSAIGNDGAIYAGSENKGLRKINALNGNVLWQADVVGGDIVYGNPVISDDGIVYVGTMGDPETGGYINAIKVDATGYPAAAAWPRFNGGNSSTGHRE